MNDRYIPLRGPFSAIVTYDDHVVGRVENGIAHPIINQFGQIVQIGLHTQRVGQLPVDEVVQLGFGEPYRASLRN